MKGELTTAKEGGQKRKEGGEKEGCKRGKEKKEKKRILVRSP